ncbi:hypothetical protein A3K93_06565 [Acinetobacter sp. NCu2D-2]|uniref:hypothetical protein n=1 Tax=Acinetobacter sp. NCu2D-2 TaxID=1608473 RepID=UPI0007CDCEBF|nr:hypothetical protein [Acinetobacter sp. NCu2D-2]ANF81887.1 hypothetical protein A3K93_06565 [Acinetobacter sp. NCu2D-2]
MELTLSVKLALMMSGVFLWVGMLTGVWKYVQIARSERARAHYYVDIAHRSSLLYAPASLILAVLAYFSVFSEQVNLLCVVANLAFFSFSIGAYILHGALKDTTNQFRTPHQLGKWTLPKFLMRMAMLGLIVAELGGTGILLLGAALGLF